MSPFGESARQAMFFRDSKGKVALLQTPDCVRASYSLDFPSLGVCLLFRISIQNMPGNLYQIRGASCQIDMTPSEETILFLRGHDKRWADGKIRQKRETVRRREGSRETERHESIRSKRVEEKRIIHQAKEQKRDRQGATPQRPRQEREVGPKIRHTHNITAQPPPLEEVR